MPVSLTDRSIRAAYAHLKRNVGSGTASLDDLKGVLAAVADKAGLAMTRAKTQLDNAVSVQEKLAIVKEGLSAVEKADLAKILDAGPVALSTEAKKFLEQVIGRTPVNPGNGAVSITAMVKQGSKVLVTGTAKPNVTVEALNLSAIPGMRLHDDDTFVLGKTDASGRLQGTVDLKAGDWLRVRTRDARGNTSDWQVIRADQLGGDAREALVAMARIELSDAGNGKIQMANNNNSRPISEPFAKLQLENQRTGEKTVIDLDDTGRFNGVPKVNGKAGDRFTLAASDGRDNTAFRTKLPGFLEVPGAGGGGSGAQIADPKPHKDDRKPDGTSRYDLKRYTGPLFHNGISPEDVVQGNIGDCYLPAAAAALAHAMPDLLRTMIKDDGNGKFTFTFKDAWGGRDTKIDVDADFYTRSWGGPLYGASSNSTDPARMELWWPLFEKAYAQLCGDFHTIGEGGSSSDVFEAVTGRRGFDESFSSSNADRMFTTIKQKLAKKLPVCMGTKDDHGGRGDFANSGVFGDHTYTVLDAVERNGVKYLKLRNPWGESEPSGNGANDGIFELKISDMPKWFNVVWSVQ
ncbi:MAG: hypothetical protein A2138_22010 [Deltaproteobacteria bacterium RBG_16_71_12]|nr:MAG: hypothetical protein A2138_22010 [Deltaproteobacteria bacterium RBG_16_71_12]